MRGGRFRCLAGRQGFAAGRRSARAMLAAAALLVAGGAGRSEEPVRLNVVGGLAGVTQYKELERPFWQTEIAARSKGRLTATVRPFDSSGLRGQEILQLMRLGVVPFGTALLSLVAGDEPELNAVDLPALNPDMATLRSTVAAYRPHLRDLLRERYAIELLGIYAYPAQVMFCTKAFDGLRDLAGRKVRTSSVGQSELMTALGAVPVLIPFGETTAALRNGVADCAITGTLSGYEIGLPNVTTHVHAMAISWGLSFFGANETAWHALPPDLQAVIREGVADLEQRIWKQADEDTQRGLACNTGTLVCSDGTRKTMTLVPISEEDAERRRTLLSQSVLPRWIERCGDSCVTAWNESLAAEVGVRAQAE